MSPCGTFALVGSVGGALDMFNLQSGKHRRRFPVALTQTEANRFRLEQLKAEETISLDGESQKTFAKGQGRHKGAITGIVVDSLNQQVISCGSDGKLKVRTYSVYQTITNT